MNTTRCIAGVALTAVIGMAACGGPDRAGAPDVTGLNLARANTMLTDAGYSSTIVENDTLFGVVLEENFVVCEQESTKGKLVPLKVAKHGC